MPQRVQCGNFKNENNPYFTINTVLPGFRLGAYIPKPSNRSEFAEAFSSANLFFQYYTGINRDMTSIADLNVFVGVEEVGLGHVRAIERGRETNGQRFLLVNGKYSGKLIVDFMRKDYPERKDVIEEGNRGQYPTTTNSVDGSKATRILGIKYHDLETLLNQTIESAKQVL